jgi:hypothetical protein
MGSRRAKQEAISVIKSQSSSVIFFKGRESECSCRFLLIDWFF